LPCRPDLAQPFQHGGEQVEERPQPLHVLDHPDALERYSAPISWLSCRHTSPFLEPNHPIVTPPGLTRSQGVFDRAVRSLAQAASFSVDLAEDLRPARWAAIPPRCWPTPNTRAHSARGLTRSPAAGGRVSPGRPLYAIIDALSRGRPGG